MAVINLATPEGQLRLETGDVADIPILSDAEYTYILSKHGNIVADSVVDALYAILARLSFETRQRLDRIEFYGNQSFEQYSKFVTDKIANLQGTNRLASNFSIYAGGLLLSDMAVNNANPDINRVVTPFECGYANTPSPYWS